MTDGSPVSYRINEEQGLISPHSSPSQPISTAADLWSQCS